MVTEKTKEAYLAKVSQIRLKFLKKVKEATIYLMQHFSWDFLMVVFSSSDFLQHHFWAYRDPTHPLYGKKLAQNFGNVIDRAYTDIDQGIGDILKTSGHQVNVFIVSDHGFGPLHKQFFVNNWLRKKGWLCLKKNPFCLSYVTFSGILSRIGLEFLRGSLPSKLAKIKIPGIKTKPWPEIVDWKRTVAYYMGTGININLKGREPLGIVNPGKEYENIIKEIRKELYEVKDPETDEKIVNKVFRPEEIYH